MRRIAGFPDRDGLVVMLILGVAALFAVTISTLSSRATANPIGNVTARTGTPDEPAQRSPIPASSQGGLILRGTGNVATQIPAVRLGTDIVANVSGQTARVIVTQAFRNTSDQWMEATYLYPLPDNGAVDTLKMVVGSRIFDGVIKPKEIAQEMYEEAKENGQKAALVEQHRPNMFRNSIANVGPGETVLVQIEFQAPIAQVAGDYSLRMPLVVGPRYLAGNDNGGSDTTTGSLYNAALLVGAADLTAPTADPDMVARAGGGLNPVSITVNLDPGFTAGAISSPYHAINIAGEGPTRTVSLADGSIPANRDFELRWSASGGAPELGLFRQTHSELDYVMATITPPSAQTAREAPPREMVFVIDNSGSMAGESMPAARRSLLYALETLRPQDSFNIIRFDDTITNLFGASVTANDRNLARAKTFTHALNANGGTQMLPALRAALDDQFGPRRDGAETTSVRQIVFLTDGSLSNEAAMMEEINQNRGRSRVFMVGIGSAPNSFLMRRMAEAGRGTFTHVGMGEEAEHQMQRLLSRLAQPVVTDLTARVEGGNIDFAPRQLPDLYAGEPVVLLGRTRHLRGTLTVSGTIEGERWSHSLDLGEATPSDVVAKLWANRRIAEVEAERWSGQMSHALADTAIEELGMDFHLVTSRTSLIAVDDTPSRPDGAQLTREELPLLLPAGWDFDHLFGTHAAMGSRDMPIESEKQRQRLELPNTSTGYRLTLMLGLMILLLGLVGAGRERILRRLVSHRLLRAAG